MCASASLHRAFRCWLCCSALLPAALCAQTPATDAAPVATPATKLTLVGQRFEATPARNGRYTLRARFQPEESAGELREGDRFTLIGRFAKATASCDGSALFRNGFEGN